VTAYFVFVDGVGAGQPDPAVNPLARGDFLLSRFAGGAGAPLPASGRAALLDARLGVEGRPQSATGQTTILTGENAPALLGRHLLGFPNPALRELLGRRSLYRRLAEAGRRAVFLNAYPAFYLRALGFDAPGEAEPLLPELAPLPTRRRVRPSATTVAFAAGGGPFRTFEDARAGRGLTHDLTGARAEALGFRLPRRTGAEAAGLFLAAGRGHDLAAFEFFETDEAGHARSMDQAAEALAKLDAFLRGVVAGLGAEDALLVTSDHGNLEDLSTRNHTLAPVPLLGFGRAAERVGEARDLTGVAPLLLSLAGAPPVG